MSITINGYTYSYVNGDFTEPVRIAKPRKTYPLPADNSVYIQEEDYMVFIDFYEPLQPSTPHPTLAGLFFLKDSPITDVGGGVGRFTRSYAKIPGFNEDGLSPGYVYSDYESYSFRVPGITTTQELFLVNYVGGYAVASGTHVITSTLAHDIDGAGKSVAVYYSVRDPINNFTYYRTQTKTSLAGTAGSTLVVSEIKDINTVVPISFQRASSNQEPYNKTVMSRVDRDYWLVGYNGINAIDDIPIISEFFITDLSTGNRTEYLSEGVPGSNPSLGDYRDWIEDKTWIAAEPSILRRWMDSDIFERSTRYVRATL
jgi:hypothetical protein